MQVVGSGLQFLQGLQTEGKKVLKEMKPWSKWNQKEFSCLHEWSQDYPSSQAG